jgi:serine phosphatase RsbU (regulator of sigma subunit)
MSADDPAETLADHSAEAAAKVPTAAPADQPPSLDQSSRCTAGGAAGVDAEKSSDFKSLCLKLERLLDDLEWIEDSAALLETILQVLVRDFHDDLGFETGRLYRREGPDYYLCGAFGKPCPVPIGHRVPPEDPAHVRTLAEGLLIMRDGHPGYDEQAGSTIRSNGICATIAVGPGITHLLVFSVEAGVDEERVLYSLWAVRHVINMKLQQGRLAGIIEEARTIQESLLPPASLQFAGYETFGRSRSAEVVGGDLFDYLLRPERVLGVAIADASGHGLPAALLARDVITGLRMGMNEKSRVSRTVERLNRVIHRAALSSKFVSLFYGEFGPGGTLSYCNAGHNPPLLQRGTTLRPLERGGLILGPNPATRYAQGQVRMQSGDVVVLYTDGLTERENSLGRQYGLARLKRILREMPDAPPRQRVEEIFTDGDRYAEGAALQDDMTVVAVRRT